MTTDSIATGQAVRLDLFANEALWLGRFDRLEVFRSLHGNAGPFEPLCDDTWSQARLPLGAGAEPSTEPGKSVALVDRTLLLRVDEAIDISVTFAGTDPLTYAEAARQISTAGAGIVRSFVLASGKLVVESLAGGLDVTLRVVGGDAAPLLGLATAEPDSVAFGRHARVSLVRQKSRYPFTDPNGATDSFYRIRYFNGATRETSDYGPAFPAPSIMRLGSDSLVRGTVDLVGASGDPIAGRSVLVFLRTQGQVVEGKAVVGGGQLRQVTDESGHAEFMLARGLAVTVSISGTDLSRDLDVPADPGVTSFNLLDPSLGSDDLFAVQRPNLPFAARRSL